MFFKVRYEDGTEFTSKGNYKDTKWKDIPDDKNIRAIYFFLPDNNILTLHDYESYNHIIEATQDIYNSNKFTIRYQYLMCKKGDKVISYRITLFQNKDARYRIGDITRREYNFGKEYNNKPTKGWKKGIK